MFLFSSYSLVSQSAFSLRHGTATQMSLVTRHLQFMDRNLVIGSKAIVSNIAGFKVYTYRGPVTLRLMGMLTDSSFQVLYTFMCTLKTPQMRCRTCFYSHASPRFVVKQMVKA